MRTVIARWRSTAVAAEKIPMAPTRRRGSVIIGLGVAFMGVAAGSHICQNCTRFLEDSELFIYEEDDD